MNIVNVGIVGCGGIHPVHVSAIEACKDARLAAVCDSKTERAAKFGGEYGVPHYTDYRELLADKSVQAVHFCVPHYLHAQMAVDAMEAGKAVLLEKPMATSLSDAQRVVETQKRTGAFMGVCFQNRYRPLVVKLNELIKSGSLGEIKGARALLTWSRNPDYYTKSGWRGNWHTEGGSLLINQSIHTLDLLQWMLGSEAGITGVRGSIGHFKFGDTIETEDTAQLLLEMDNRMDVLFFGSNGYCEDSFVLIDVLAEKARVRLEDVLTVEWADGRRDVEEERLASGEKSYWGNGHEPLIADFYRCFLEGRDFPIGVDEGLKTVQLLDMVYNYPNINRLMK